MPPSKGAISLLLHRWVRKYPERFFINFFLCWMYCSLWCGNLWVGGPLQNEGEYVEKWYRCFDSILCRFIITHHGYFIIHPRHVLPNPFIFTVHQSPHHSMLHRRFRDTETIIKLRTKKKMCETRVVRTNENCILILRTYYILRSFCQSIIKSWNSLSCEGGFIYRLGPPSVHETILN